MEVINANTLLGLPPHREEDADFAADGSYAPPQTDAQIALAASRKAARQIFIATLMEGNNISEAARESGIARSTAYEWLKDPVFAAEVDQARVVTVQKLEKEAHRRAVRGSDKLLMFLLQAHDPKKYKPAEKLEHSGAVELATAILAARKRVPGAQA